jgi:hypothetical protein
MFIAPAGNRAGPRWGPWRADGPATPFPFVCRWPSTHRCVMFANIYELAALLPLVGLSSAIATSYHRLIAPAKQI